VSISPIFYEQLFHAKVLCAALMCLQFGLVIFWQKDFGAKAAHKMLVKLTPGHNDMKPFLRMFIITLSFFLFQAFPAMSNILRVRPELT
jgi:hypothetical protein